MTTPSHARAREQLTERARQLVQDLGRAPRPKERVWFILDAFEDDLWVRGESAAWCAAEWVCAVNTVEQSAAVAAIMLDDPANLERARYEVTTRALRRSDDIYERARMAADREAGSLYQASNAALDTYGKATGAIAAATNTTNVLVDNRGNLRPEAAREVARIEEALMVAAERAAQRLGIAAADWHAALAVELGGDDVPALVASDSDG